MLSLRTRSAIHEFQNLSAQLGQPDDFAEHLIPLNSGLVGDGLQVAVVALNQLSHLPERWLQKNQVINAPAARFGQMRSLGVGDGEDFGQAI